MFNAIANIFRIPELRNRILFTLFILIVYRIGAHIPIPGINVEALRGYFDEAGRSGFVDFFDLFSGGALKRFTIFALGIMPYISSSIIIDLLKTVFPYLNNLAKEGAEGRKKLAMYIKYGTVLLCIIQSFALTTWMKSMKTGDASVVPDEAGIMFVLISVIAITTGTIVLVWLGEIITDRGIGNGISIIIMAGIVVRAPQAVAQTLRKISETGEPIVGIMLSIVFLVVIAAAILLTQGTRRIPVQYGKRMTGQGVTQATSQFIPMKINAAGVIPVIFASALLMFPSQVLSMVGGNFHADGIMAKLSYLFSPGQPLYVIFYSLLIIFFCYFYTSIKFNPNDVADNLKKYGGFIPGIRPGSNTSEYLMFILNRITLFGSVFLAAIAIVPDFILKLWPDQVTPEMAYMFGGTSLLIIVGVALDTLKQIESQLLMRHYDGFIKGKKIKGRQ